jgi:hypothetical protein
MSKTLLSPETVEQPKSGAVIRSSAWLALLFGVKNNALSVLTQTRLRARVSHVAKSYNRPSGTRKLEREQAMKDKTVVLDTEYRNWNSGTHYSVMTKSLVRRNNVWFCEVKSHEVDLDLGWVGNHQTHACEIALDGLDRAVAHRKSERQRRHDDRAYSRGEAERFARFESFLKSCGFVAVEPKKKTTVLAYQRGTLTVRKMWHGDWRIEGNGPSQVERSLDAVESAVAKITQ